jgi:hypothetical protein
MKRNNKEETHHKTLRLFLTEEEILVVKPWEECTKELLPYLAKESLSPMGKFREKELVRLLTYLHNASKWYADAVNEAEYQRRVPSLSRRARLNWTRARSHIAQSLKLVNRAEASLSPKYVAQLEPGVLQFHEAVTSLESLNTALSELEIINAALIHPDLRTLDEKEQAGRSPDLFRHTEFSMKKGSAALKSKLTELLVDGLLKYTHGKVPLHRIDTIISKVFEIALNQTVTVTAANVKTMRLRSDQRKKMNSATASIEES